MIETVTRNQKTEKIYDVDEEKVTKDSTASQSTDNERNMLLIITTHRKICCNMVLEMSEF